MMKKTITCLNRWFSIPVILSLLLLACNTTTFIPCADGGGDLDGGTTQARVEVLFTPSTGGIESRILELLDAAQSRVYIAMFYFTSQSLAAKLVALKNKGIEVKVLADNEQVAAGGSEKITYMQNNGVNVKVDGPGQSMHHKFAVIDSAIVLTGSYNWTYSAEHQNTENMVVIHSPVIAAKYEQIFNGFFP